MYGSTPLIAGDEKLKVREKLDLVKTDSSEENVVALNDFSKEVISFTQSVMPNTIIHTTVVKDEKDFNTALNDLVNKSNLTDSKKSTLNDYDDKKGRSDFDDQIFDNTVLLSQIGVGASIFALMLTENIVNSAEAKLIGDEAENNYQINFSSYKDCSNNAENINLVAVINEYPSDNNLDTVVEFKETMVAEIDRDSMSGQSGEGL